MSATSQFAENNYIVTSYDDVTIYTECEEDDYTIVLDMGYDEDGIGGA